MTEKYRTLENTIRDHARKQMQEKVEAAKLRLTTKVMEQPKPVEEEISGQVLESDEDKVKALGWSQNEIGKWVHPDHPDYASLKAKHVISDLPDLEKLKIQKAEAAKPRLKKEELEEEEVIEATRKDQIDAIGKYHSERMTKGQPDAKYHAVQRNRASRIKNMIKGTGPNPAVTQSKEGRKTLLKYAADDSKLAKSLKKEAVEPVEEFVSSTTSSSIDTSAKLDSQRKNMAKQKQNMQANLQKQKQAKAAQDAKDRAMEDDELKKVRAEETELTEWRVHNYERASKLQALHNRLYNRLSAAGDLVKAEMHRKKASEYKRILYTAKDNPGKLPSETT
jgi:hypothetical protein